MTGYLINNFLKFFFLMTPFFALSMFLSMTPGWSLRAKRRLSVSIGFSVLVITVTLLFFGEWIFRAFDITLDAFRIGGGALLFLSASGLVAGKVEDKQPVKHGEFSASEREISNIAVVPLAIPVVVGPGTIGALLVIGADVPDVQERLVCAGGLALAILALTVLLFLATWIEEKLGRHLILILSKITGLILAAMAAQMIFTGIRFFLRAE